MVDVNLGMFNRPREVGQGQQKTLALQRSESDVSLSLVYLHKVLLFL